MDGVSPGGYAGVWNMDRESFVSALFICADRDIPRAGQMVTLLIVIDVRILHENMRL